MEYFVTYKYLVSYFVLYCERVNNMEKVKTSMSLDKDVYEYIQKLADEERLNLSQIVNRYFYQMMVKEKDEEKG